MDSHATVVIITAKDAAATIGKAVSSALAQAPVVEVVVVDDGSTDDTAGAARTADDGTGRLKLLRFDSNRGPAFGRNAARDASKAPLIAVLDADDFMGAGRLERLYRTGGEDWELLADDLYFASEPDEATVFDRLLAPGAPLPEFLTLSRLGEGNIPVDRPRRELGFLKPVVRRDFIDREAIRYDERLRLGEDFIFYGQCVARGGRFKLVEACGYYAIQYPNSLSARHRTEDLEAYHAALVDFARAARQQGHAVGRLKDYVRLVRNRMAFRKALDAKQRRGLAGVVSAARDYPGSTPYIIGEVARAKLSSALTWLRQ